MARGKEREGGDNNEQVATYNLCEKNLVQRKVQRFIKMLKNLSVTQLLGMGWASPPPLCDDIVTI